MKFGHIELFCRDVKKNAEFFIKVLGFELVTQQSEELVWVGLDNFEILLKKGEPQSGQSYELANQGYVFYTGDLEQTKLELEHKGLQFKGTDSGNPKCPTFQDLEGHWFQLVNPNDH